jgi:hypothetical protein
MRRFSRDAVLAYVLLLVSALNVFMYVTDRLMINLVAGALTGSFGVVLLVVLHEEKK